jgi:hypothetical protein
MVFIFWIEMNWLSPVNFRRRKPWKSPCRHVMTLYRRMWPLREQLKFLDNNHISKDFTVSSSFLARRCWIVSVLLVDESVVEMTSSFKTRRNRFPFRQHVRRRKWSNNLKFDYHILSPGILYIRLLLYFVS